MIDKVRLQNILNEYDSNNITIGVMGSHSALDVCRGAKDEGFKTLVVCQKGREHTYAQHYKTRDGIGIVDEVIVLDKFADILNDEVQQQLRAHNVIFVPHRSFEVYLDFAYDRIETEFAVPMFGNRYLLKAEERTSANNQYDLLRKAGIRIPKIFAKPDDIDRCCLVKLPEKTRKFERSFFHCSSSAEYQTTIKHKVDNDEIDPARLCEAVIEEFVVGPLVNFNYFYSPLSKRLELLGTDTRRQTNLDGFLRLPTDQQQKVADIMQPKFEEAGHIAVTVLESMLENVFDIGQRFIDTVQQEYAPGPIGPFALQSAIIAGPPKKEIVVFDVSLRVPGSPGIQFTPYSRYLHGKDISAGRRIAMEIAQAQRQDRLLEVIT